MRLYTAVTDLSELRSQGQQFYSISWSPPNGLSPGDTGDKVRFLQYMLSVLSSHIPQIPPLAVDGVYGQNTRDAVLAAQRFFRLPETGTVGAQTWDLIYDQFAGIETVTFRDEESFPTVANRNNRNGRNQYARTSIHTQFPGRNLSNGSRDPVSQEVVR